MASPSDQELTMFNEHPILYIAGGIILAAVVLFVIVVLAAIVLEL